MKSFFADGVEKLTAKARPAKSKDYLSVNSNQVMYKHYNSKNCAPDK
jgi:hypothetical protein